MSAERPCRLNSMLHCPAQRYKRKIGGRKDWTRSPSLPDANCYACARFHPVVLYRSRSQLLPALLEAPLALQGPFKDAQIGINLIRPPWVAPFDADRVPAPDELR